jgi:4-amino-4-deoxychorismate lyase
MSARVLREGRVRLWLDPTDRGLAYGDGLFETMRVHGGVPVLWAEHWQRLAAGAARLGIALPDEAWVRREADAVLEQRDQAVLKLVLTRGIGERGYAPPAVANPTVVLSAHAPPPVHDGLVLRWCRTRIAVQPQLAGIKHLNRLEQVLARAEWDDPEIDDGVLCDTEDRVVCTTSMNLFARIGGRWLTPSVARCGVAGILRGWLLGQGLATEADISQADLSHADALCACNAVRGILSVRRLGGHAWPTSPDVLVLQRRLADAHPAYAVPAPAA